FDGPASLARRTRWVARPSAGIPFASVRTGAVLGQALQQAGRPADAQNVLATTEKIAHGTQLGRLLAAGSEGQ
ncbi:MAG: hypothetical protein ACR2MQ_11140, partial [Gemmatimonadaceae bacterium]